MKKFSVLTQLLYVVTAVKYVPKNCDNDDAHAIINFFHQNLCNLCNIMIHNTIITYVFGFQFDHERSL